MPHAIRASLPTLLHNRLRIVQNERGHHHQPDIQVHLIHDLRLHENVRQTEQRHRRQHAHQRAAQKQKTATVRNQRTGAERHKHQTGRHRRRHDDLRIHVDHMRQQRSHRMSGQQAEAEQHAEPHVEVLLRVRNAGQAEHQHQRTDGRQNARLVDARDVGDAAERGGHCGRRQAGVHLDEVLAHFGLTAGIDKRENWGVLVSIWNIKSYRKIGKKNYIFSIFIGQIFYDTLVSRWKYR